MKRKRHIDRITKLYNENVYYLSVLNFLTKKEELDVVDEEKMIELMKKEFGVNDKGLSPKDIEIETKPIAMAIWGMLKMGWIEYDDEGKNLSITEKGKKKLQSGELQSVVAQLSIAIENINIQKTVAIAGVASVLILMISLIIEVISLL